LELPDDATECDIRSFPVNGAGARLSFSPELARALEQEARSADLIHIHGLYLHPTYAAARAAVAGGVPYILSPHGSLAAWNRRRGRAQKLLTHVAWQRRVFQKAALLHATTAEEAAEWPAYARKRRCAVVPNGVDLSRFDALPDRRVFRSELGIDPTEPLVLNVGRISAKKALDLLVLAVANLHRSGVRAHLALVGPDDEGLGATYRALAEARGIADFVHIVGPRSGVAKLAAFSAADAWALPSHTENFGIVVVEALAAGAPVVLSREVNLAAQIARAGACVTVSPSEHETTVALLRVLSDRSLRRDLASRGRLFARRFDWPPVAREMMHAYCAVLETKRFHGIPADSSRGHRALPPMTRV
jgi:glycosyltransferase involved in cell wall biosynthesis